jgi:PAS domain S-box-containing protein
MKKTKSGSKEGKGGDSPSQLIDAIKAGEVDAFAVNGNNQPEIYTLQSGDYAYRLLIEEIGEGAVNTTEDGLIVYTNSSFIDLLGLPYEEIIGKFINEFIHQESKNKFEQLFKESLSGRSNGEITLHAGNKIIPVYISLTSLEPKLATVGIIITDQSEKKRNERTILQYQKELELKNIELAQNNIELTSFTFIASHDLQEPLRKIQTFCNLIMSELKEDLPATTRDYFQRILKASNRMQNLISSLLNYSRMNSRDVAFEPADLNEVLDESINNIHELIEESNATIEHDKLPVIPCVPLQINQLFTNLIINSIKYKRQGHPPVIQISSILTKPGEMGPAIQATNKEYWKIIFADNGIGFEQQYADKIFELFQRLHSHFDYEGTGIGLAICKKIVQNHQGYMQAIGRPGLGASFEIYLPLNQ